MFDGNRLALERTLELPGDYYDDEDNGEDYDEDYEAERDLWETEEGCHDREEFSIDEILGCLNVYEVVNKKLKPVTPVKSACASRNISYDTFKKMSKYFIGKMFS